jgi:hypothetical protein
VRQQHGEVSLEGPPDGFPSPWVLSGMLRERNQGDDDLVDDRRLRYQEPPMERDAHRAFETPDTFALVPCGLLGGI